jgi:hypothetical protein
MSKRLSKSVPRAFPWRKSFLSAIRRSPHVGLACKAAGISRNTVYTHLRKDAAFRRRWERAFERGLDAEFVRSMRELVRDPKVQGLMAPIGVALKY